jgi:pimeloyl-ACP methyl ester carboxylesterase
VITRGIPDEQGPGAEAREEEHRTDHATLAAMSRRGRLIVAAKSGHHVQLDEPDLVVTVIQEVMQSARK